MPLSVPSVTPGVFSVIPALLQILSSADETLRIRINLLLVDGVPLAGEFVRLHPTGEHGRIILPLPAMIALARASGMNDLADQMARNAIPSGAPAREVVLQDSASGSVPAFSSLAEALAWAAAHQCDLLFADPTAGLAGFRPVTAVSAAGGAAGIQATAWLAVANTIAPETWSDPSWVAAPAGQQDPPAQAASSPDSPTAASAQDSSAPTAHESAPQEQSPAANDAQGERSSSGLHSAGSGGAAGSVLESLVKAFREPMKAVLDSAASFIEQGSKITAQAAMQILISQSGLTQAAVLVAAGLTIAEFITCIDSLTAHDAAGTGTSPAPAPPATAQPPAPLADHDLRPDGEGSGAAAAAPAQDSTFGNAGSTSNTIPGCPTALLP